MNNEFDLDLGIPATAPEPVEEPRCTIFIDEVEGQPNYEVVGVNGQVHQIMRGVNVEVPRSVVEVLRNAVATRFVSVKRSDGVDDLQRSNYSSIPWRLVG